MCSPIYFYIYYFQFLLLTVKIRCGKNKSEKRGVPLLFIIPNNNFEKFIPYLIQNTLREVL